MLLSEGCPARWQLLQERLESVCPTETSTVPLWRRGPRGPGGSNPYFLLEVSAPDCPGILHGKCFLSLLLQHLDRSGLPSWGFLSTHLSYARGRPLGKTFLLPPGAEVDCCCG